MPCHPHLGAEPHICICYNECMNLSAPFAGLRAALFDLDGTLVTTHIDFPAMTAAMTAMAAAADVPQEVFEGRDILNLVEAAASHLSTHGKDGAAFKQTAWNELSRREWEGCAHPILVPGADTLLAALHERGTKIAVVTRNCRAVSEWLFTQFPLPYDVLLAREDTRCPKPAPEHLWEALAVIDAQPADSFMCGDHWMDVQAGKAAQCAATLGVLGTHTEDWFAPCPPTRSVTDLSAALPLFGL